MNASLQFAWLGEILGLLIFYSILYFSLFDFMSSKSSMSQPFQIACICKAPQFGDAGLLFAASGPRIASVDLSTGSILSQWPARDETDVVSDCSGEASAFSKLTEERDYLGSRMVSHRA